MVKKSKGKYKGYDYVISSDGLGYIVTKDDSPNLISSYDDKKYYDTYKMNFSDRIDYQRKKLHKDIDKYSKDEHRYR